MGDDIFKNISSFNTNGLGTIKKKRVGIFKWVKRNFPGIIFLQETHSTQKTQGEWRREIGHQYVTYFSNSRGVCTLIPKSTHKYVKEFYSDNLGRTLIITLEIGGVMYTLINVYFPNQDKPKDQMIFIDHLEKCVNKFEGSNIIIGGDFNIVLNPKLDKWGGDNEKPSNVAMYLKGCFERNNLIDAWRMLYPTTKRYTWRRKNPLQQSRIDLWAMSDNLVYNLTDSKIELSINSDHSVIP